MFLPPHRSPRFSKFIPGDLTLFDVGLFDTFVGKEASTPFLAYVVSTAQPIPTLAFLSSFLGRGCLRLCYTNSKSLSLSVRGDGHVAARIIEVTGTMLNSQVHCTEHQPRPALRAAGMVPRVQRHVGQRGRRLSGLTLSDGPRTWCSAYRLAKVWCRGKHNGTHLSATVGVQLVGMKGDESVCGDRWRVSTYSALAVPASDLPGS